jgi:hypothetical protein
VLQAGTTRSREVSARIGVTNDEAENAPRLRVLYGEDSRESKPPNEVPSQDTPRQGLIVQRYELVVCNRFNLRIGGT